MAKRVVLEAPLHAAIGAAARACAPEEACGALLGRSDFAESWEVCAVRALRNEAAEPQREFLISSATLREVERDAEAQNQEVVGFFHSHPHGSIPSTTDFVRAWPGYIYIIADAETDGLNAWTLSTDGSDFLHVLVESG